MDRPIPVWRKRTPWWPVRSVGCVRGSTEAEPLRTATGTVYCETLRNKHATGRVNTTSTTTWTLCGGVGTNKKKSGKPNDEKRWLSSHGYDGEESRHDPRMHGGLWYGVGCSTVALLPRLSADALLVGCRGKSLSDILYCCEGEMCMHEGRTIFSLGTGRYST